MKPHPPATYDRAVREREVKSESVFAATAPARKIKKRPEQRTAATSDDPNSSGDGTGSGAGTVAHPRMTDYLRNIAESRKQEEEEKAKKEVKRQRCVVLYYMIL